MPVGRDELIKKRRRSRVHTVTAQGTKTAARNADSDEEEMSDFRLMARYRPILCADFLDAGELLVVERPLMDLLQALPPAFFKPKYGT